MNPIGYGFVQKEFCPSVVLALIDEAIIKKVDIIIIDIVELKALFVSNDTFVLSPFLVVITSERHKRYERDQNRVMKSERQERVWNMKRTW